MMKRIICALLVLLVLILPLVSCGKGNTNNSGNVTEPAPQNDPQAPNKVIIDTDAMKKAAVDALNNISSVDLGGDNGFTIACCDTSNYLPENTDTKYNTALDLRRRLFETKYNTELYTFSDDMDSMITDAKNKLLAGLYYTDLFSVPTEYIGRFVAEGLVMKSTAVPGADFTKPYFDTALMNQTVAGYESYAIYGDFNKDIEDYYCLYINRDAAVNSGLKIPYDAVKNGSWTWDVLLNMVRAYSGNGLAVSTPQLLSAVIYKSSGEGFLATQRGSLPTVNYGSETGNKALYTLNDLCSTWKMLYDSAAESGNALSDFKAGKALFLVATVGDMQNVCTMANDWCVLPLPKLKAEQEDYISYASGKHSAILCYAGADAERLAPALEGLCAASTGGYLTQGYYGYLIDTSIRDSYTLDMMDYISGVKGGRPAIDFTDVYANQIPDLYSYTRGSFVGAVDSWDIKPFAESAQGKLAPILAKHFQISG